MFIKIMETEVSTILKQFSLGLIKIIYIFSLPFLNKIISENENKKE